MPVQPTSREAFESVNLTARQAEVLAAIVRLREASDREIAAHLAWPINRVTPRRGELSGMGRVVRARIRRGPAGRKESTWSPAPQQFVLPLKIERRVSP